MRLLRKGRDTGRRIVKRIIAERPAAVLIAGDFVYKPTDEDELDEVEREDLGKVIDVANEAADLLRPLVEAGIPTYAALEITITGWTIRIR